MTDNVPENRYSIGTRAILPRKPDGTYRVVCATCDAGGTIAHKTRRDAWTAAVRDSNKPCRYCGAR